MIEWTDFPIGDHRIACPACAKRPNDKTMGVTVAGDEHGVAHCFRCSYVETRQHERELTVEERKAFARRMDALRRQHETEQRQRQAEAAAAAALRWAAATPVAGHPYLTAKQVKAHGLRLGDWQKKDPQTGEVVTLRSVLYVPMRDPSGVLRSLQGITEEGEKLFLSGGRVKGSYHSIGRPSGRLLIAEGYATAATLHEATGDAVAVAFNAGNLMAVAQALRSKFPCLSLVIAADDDHQTRDPRTGELSNPGVTAARAAALKVGGKVAAPDFSGLPRTSKDTDFNDLMRLAGAVKIGGAE
jgi:putative DNA primase/helicase